MPEEPDDSRADSRQVVVIDDDDVQDHLRRHFETTRVPAVTFSSCEQFQTEFKPQQTA